MHDSGTTLLDFTIRNWEVHAQRVLSACLVNETERGQRMGKIGKYVPALPTRHMRKLARRCPRNADPRRGQKLGVTNDSW